MFRKSARGLFDFLMASLAIVTLLTTTPTGELIGRGARWALGIKGKQRDLISFFGTSEKPGPAAFTAPEPTSLVASIARAYGAAPAMLKGFAIASAADPAAPELAMDLTAAGRDLLRARGASEADLATSSGRLRAVSQAITDLTRDLGSPDAALTALVLGLEPVRYAVERVRAERGDLTLEAIAPHLPPSSRSRANQVVGLALALSTLYDLSWPVPRDTRIGSRFGMRVDPISGAQALHNGVDLSVPSGTPIAATGDGVVARAGEDGVNGKFIVISHGRGITTGYCHNSELLVARGAKIARGTIITHSGNTGRSTGAHLHYTVAIEGVAVDPMALFSDSERNVIAARVDPTAAVPPTKAVVPAHVADAGVARPATARDAGNPGPDAAAEVATGPDAGEPVAGPDAAEQATPPAEPPAAVDASSPAPAEPPAADAGPLEVLP